MSIFVKSKLRHASEALRTITLGDGIQILNYIKEHPGTDVQSIYKSIGIEQSSCSLKLRELKDFGFVKSERKGKNVHYNVNMLKIAPYIEFAETMSNNESYKRF